MSAAKRPIPFSLLAFSSQSLTATKKAWDTQIKDLAGELVPSEYQRILEWVGSHVDYGSKTQESFAYGVFQNEGGPAEAIIEVSYTMLGKKWLKMLDIHLSPAMYIAFTGGADLVRLTDTYAAAVIGTVNLTSKAHPTQTVKLYGRSGTLLAFLKGVGAYIEQNGGVEGLKVGIEGRWLVIRPS